MINFWMVSHIARSRWTITLHEEEETTKSDGSAICSRYAKRCKTTTIGQARNARDLCWRTFYEFVSQAVRTG